MPLKPSRCARQFGWEAALSFLIAAGRRLCDQVRRQLNDYFMYRGTVQRGAEFNIWYAELKALNRREQDAVTPHV
jgi:hypothetical protein